MFSPPDRRLSASNSAILASQSFLVPLTLRSVARSSQVAFDSLHRTFDEVKGFVPQLAVIAPGALMIGFDENVSPRASHVSAILHGKDYRFDLTVALKCPIPVEHDFWARIRLISAVYDRLTELAAGFESKKGIELFFEESRLDQQKEEERLHGFRK